MHEQLTSPRILLVARVAHLKDELCRILEAIPETVLACEITAPQPVSERTMPFNACFPKDKSDDFVPRGCILEERFMI